MPNRWKAGAAKRLPASGLFIGQPPAEGMTVNCGDWSLLRYGALGRFGAADRELSKPYPLVGLKPLAHRLVDISGGERRGRSPRWWR